MARLFPFRSEPAQNEGHPRVVDLEGEDADAVFGALSSTTARQIYARLEDEPGTPSDVADAIDSSIQNVRYHLENLEGAGLIEVVDTWYSSRGNEMSVYATTDGPLIVTSDESTASRLREALSRFVGGIGALAGGSLLVQYGLTRWAESAADSSAEGAGAPAAGADDRESTSGTDDSESTDVTTESGDAGGSADGDEAAGDFEAQDTTTSGNESDAADTGADGNAVDTPADEEVVTADWNESAGDVSDGGAEVAEVLFDTVPPGLIFFLGGLIVLLAVMCYWYWYRPSHYRTT
ncbi:winged helix-turn-helix domain-containing protein [Natronorubrum halophilum]|uniref:winged helix-turn-helix domain-containing protein n=1 Tax=Natronorubrum halophilum TaxID=1702106 RepID=UPI000EF6BC68|nr:helix-turn-helix domain-containing protein [Natronorubrum halophilum]